MRLLSTDRLHIRRITLNDAAYLYDLMNDKDWIQNIGDRGVHSIADAEDYIRDRFFKAYQESNLGFYALILKSTQNFIGIVGLIEREGLDSVDIGYGLLTKYRGFGYAFEATKAMYDYGLINLELKKIIAIVDPDNQSSINILKKLGLSFEKMIQLPDENKKIMLFS